MANPVTAVEEAIGAAMDGWKPESGKELYAFLASFPDLIDKLRESFNGVIDLTDQSGELEGVIGDELEQVDSAFSSCRDAADNLKVNFHTHYSFFLGDE